MANISYMAALVTLPVIVDQTGLYRTRKGETVTIYSIGDMRATRFCCRGTYADGIGEDWHRSGRLFANIESDNDIVARA